MRFHPLIANAKQALALQPVVAEFWGVLGTVYLIPAFTRKKEEMQLPNTPTSSDAKRRASLSLRPQFGAGCG